MGYPNRFGEAFDMPMEEGVWIKPTGNPSQRGEQPGKLVDRRPVARCHARCPFEGSGSGYRQRAQEAGVERVERGTSRMERDQREETGQVGQRSPRRRRWLAAMAMAWVLAISGPVAADEYDPTTAGHPLRIETGLPKQLQADRVGLLLLFPTEVDPMLHPPGLEGDQGSLTELWVVRSGDGCGEGSRKERQGEAAHLGQVPLQMSVGDMGDFVGDDRGELALIFGQQDQTAIDPDIAGRAGEGVDLGVIDDKKVERSFRLDLSRKALA